MKFTAIQRADAALVLGLLLAPLPAAAMLDCKNIVVDKQKYDLRALHGPHSVVMSSVDSDYFHNTTYTVDICSPLKKKGDVKKTEQCPNGAWICAIKRLIDVDNKDDDHIERALPIAGNLQNHGGGPLDHTISHLSADETEAGKEGLRLVMKGGYDDENAKKRSQMAVIDFLCDEERDGAEGEYDPEDQYEDDPEDPEGEDTADAAHTNPLLYRDEQTGPVQLGIDKDPSLVFKSYGPKEDDPKVDLLRMTWSSKHVCKSSEDDGADDGPDEKEPSSHWGFFTWVVILVFLGTAAYLIFGSWLNYNRYGARGWDLLPHGDTIRDIPYLMKDWTRRALNTVQGSGSRGGYSAV